jgi:hypothetical protein
MWIPHVKATLGRFGLRLAMTALVQNRSRFSNTANIETAKDAAMICGAILLVTMLFASV